MNAGHKKPPERLLDDPTVSESLREDLQRAADVTPDYDTGRGLLALQAAIGALGYAGPVADAVGAQGSAATGAGAGAAPGTAAVAAKGAGTAVGAAGALSGKAAVAAWVTAVGLTVAGVVTVVKPAPSAAPSPVEKVAAPVSSAVVAPSVAKVAPVEDAPVAVPAAPTAEPQVAPSAEAAVAPSATARAERRHVAAVDPDVALRREIDHLARVKVLLRTDPAAAYALAQAGNRTLTGMLRQERDGLAVFALHAAGKSAQARLLGSAFLQRYPASPLHERIASIVAGEGE